MRVLITGATGFVGRHLTERLLEQGHEVVGLSREAEGSPGARQVRCDIRDPHVLVRRLESIDPDAVVHLAAVSFLPDVERDPGRAFEVNVNGTLALLTSVQRAQPLARVVLLSSAEVYGRSSLAAESPLSEDLPVRPVTLYGASKAAAEHVAQALAREQLDLVVLRPFNLIGPGQRAEFVLPAFARQVARLERMEALEPDESADGERVLRHGNLEAVRDFLDVRDAARAIEEVLKLSRDQVRPGEVFNLCSGKGVSIAALLNELLDRARRKIRAENDPELLREVDLPELVGDPGRLRERTGFQAGTPFADTVEAVLEEARATGSP